MTVFALLIVSIWHSFTVECISPSGALRSVYAHRQPYIVRACTPRRIPSVAHVNVSGFLRSLDDEFKRILRTVRVLGLRRDVAAAGPWSVDRAGCKNFVGIGSPACLARNDEEIDAICLEHSRSLVSTSS